MKTNTNYLLENGFYDELSVSGNAEKIRKERGVAQEVTYPDVDFKSGYRETGIRMAQQTGGVVAYPTDEKMHFGNPFMSGLGDDLVFADGISTVKEAVQAYRDWLVGAQEYKDVEPERRQWIIDNILSGELIGKPVIDISSKIPGGKGKVGYFSQTYQPQFSPSSAMVLLGFISHPEELARQLNEEQRVNNDIKDEKISSTRLPYHRREVSDLLKWLKEQPDELKANIDAASIASQELAAYTDDWFNSLSLDARTELLSRPAVRMLETILATCKASRPVREKVSDVADAFKQGWDNDMTSDRERAAFLNEQYNRLPSEAKSVLAQFIRLYVGVDHEKDVTRMDLWFSGLSTAEKSIIMDSGTIEMVSRFKEMSGYAEDLKMAMDDIITNFGPGWDESFDSETRKDDYLKEAFFALPASVRNAIYVKMSSETYRKNLSASYDFIMVGVGKRSFAEVMACVPSGVSMIVDVRSYTGSAKDKLLLKSGIEQELMKNGIKYMHVKELSYKNVTDLDAYSASSAVREKLDELEGLLKNEDGSKRQIVLLTDEVVPSKGVAATGLGQALERDGYNVVYNSVYPNSLKSYTKTHSQVIGAVLNNLVIESGKLSQIHFYDSGKFYTDDGVVLREHVVAQEDRRIRGHDNYGNPVKPIQSKDSPIGVVKSICKKNNSDVAFVVSFGEVDFVKPEARAAANSRLVEVTLRPDPQLLLSPEYAERKAAACFADYQGILDDCIRNAPEKHKKKITPLMADWDRLDKAQKEAAMQVAEVIADLFALETPMFFSSASDMTIEEELTGKIAERCFNAGISMGTDTGAVIYNEMPEGKWDEMGEKQKAPYIDYATAVVDGLEKRFGLMSIMNGNILQNELTEAVAEIGHTHRSAALKDAGWEYGPKADVIVDVRAAFVGSFESAMMVEKVQKAATDWELAMLEKAEAMDSEAGFTLSDEQLDDRSRYAGTNSSGRVGINSSSLDEGRPDMMKMTGVTEEIMVEFFNNFFSAIERGVSYASLYKEEQLKMEQGEDAVTEQQVDRERRKIAGRVYHNLGLQRKMSEATAAYDECRGVEDAYVQSSKLEETFDEFKIRFYGSEDAVPEHVKSYKRKESFDEFRKHFFSIDNKAREEFIENFEITPALSNISRCMSPCNPGLQRAALLSMQQRGRDTIPVLAKNNEFTAFLSTTREGKPVNWVTREGRKGRVDRKRGEIILAAGQGEAYLLNPFHMGLGMEESVSRKKASEKEAKRLFAIQNGRGVQPGLTPVQIRALSQKLNYSPANIQKLNAYLVSEGSFIYSSESMTSFLQYCENVLNIRRPGSNLSAAEVEAALESATKLSSDELEQGIGSVSVVSDHFPSALKAWDGYTKKEQVSGKRDEIDFVYVTDAEGREVDGEELDEKALKDIAGKRQTKKDDNDLTQEEIRNDTRVVHVEYDSAAVPRTEEYIERKEPSPSMLYFRGDLSVFDRPTVMLFGDGSTENPLDCVRSAVIRSVDVLNSQGVSIVSVLRQGTDLIALREAVDRGNRVIAVLPEGFCQTKYNDLINDIVEKGGCVVSEVDPDSRRGMIYDAALVSERAERMAAVIGKHVLVIDAKAGRNGEPSRAYEGVCESATNGVSVLRYSGLTDRTDRYMVSGNEKLLNENVNVQEVRSDTLEGITECMRMAWNVSPVQKEEEAREQMERKAVEVKKAERLKNVTVDKLDFYAVRNRDEQVFVVRDIYADVREVIRKTYGEDVEIVNTIEEAEDRLYGNSIEVLGERVDTFDGWKGTQPLVDRPYRVPLIYYKDVIYTPTNAPEAAVGVSDEVRTAHRAFFDRIAAAAVMIQKKTNEELGLQEGTPALRIANSRYFVKTPTEVVLYEGMGEDAEQDRVVAKVTIGHNGLLDVHNNFFSIERGEEAVLTPLKGRRDQVSVSQVDDVVNSMYDAVFDITKREKEMYMGLDREKEEELKQNFESGFYKHSVAAIDAAEVLPYIGTTLFEVNGKEELSVSREEAMAILDKEMSSLIRQHGKLNASLKKAETALSEKVGSLEGAVDLEDDQYAEQSDNLESLRQDINIFAEDRNKVLNRMAEVEMARRRVALAEVIGVSVSAPDAKEVVLCVDGNAVTLDMSKLPAGAKRDAELKKASENIELIRTDILGRRKEMRDVIGKVEGSTRAVDKQAVDKMLAERRHAHLMDPVVTEDEVVESFRNGKSIIKREGLYTVVNRDLTFVSNPPVYYREIEQMGASQRILVRKDNGKYNVINAAGRELFEKDCDVIREGQERIGEVCQDGKWFFVEWRTGCKPLSDMKYDEVRSFKDGFAAVRMDRLWTFIEKPGNDRSMTTQLSEAELADRKAKAEAGLPFTAFYDEVRDFSEGVAAVYVKGKGWNLMDEDDNLFLDPDGPLFSEVQDFHDGKAVGLINGEVVALDFNGDRVDTSKENEGKEADGAGKPEEGQNEETPGVNESDEYAM